MQEIYLGGISEEDRKILNRLADQDPLASLKNVGKKTSRIGVRLRKFWKGKNYDVIIRAGNQYEYDGKLYRSLSAIASVITGTHWNGKKFFGVK